MSNRKTITIPVVFILLSVFISNIYSEVSPMGFPSANLNVANAVSVDLLRKVALDRAQQTFGSVTPGPEIPCCDSNGNIVCYMFIFKLGGGKSSTSPSHSTIMGDVKAGRSLYLQGLEQRDRGAMSQNYETGKKKQWGVGDYCTVVVSARDDLIPVLEYQEGLPRYYTMGDLILQKAKDNLGGGATLKRIFYAGPSDELYEFGDGSRKILISPYSLKTYQNEQNQKQILEKASQMKVKDPIMENEAKEQWRKLKEKFQ